MTEVIRTGGYDNNVIQEVVGSVDKNIRFIEKKLDVDISIRADSIFIEGDDKAAADCAAMIRELLALAEGGETIDEQKLTYTMDSINDSSGEFITSVEDDVICHTVQGKPVKPKTVGQKKYVEAIENKMIVFGIGPAGTGKTYLAIAEAVTAFKVGS